MTAATANNEPSNYSTYRAAAAITANRLVKYGAADSDGNPQITPCTAITDLAIGVSLITAALGDMCDIQVGGVAKIEASAAVIAANAPVCPGAAGAGVCVTATGAGNTAVAVGVAEFAAAGTGGEIIQVRLGKLPNLPGPVNV